MANLLGYKPKSAFHSISITHFIFHVEMLGKNISVFVPPKLESIGDFPTLGGSRHTG